MDQKLIHDVAARLIASRVSIGDLEPQAVSGVYAIFLNEGSSLGEIVSGQDGLIYIGKSKDLAAREVEHHFGDKNTGFSTLRRSIGAILKHDLQLTVHPRSDGASESNVRNYKFDADGDRRLSEWMAMNLTVAVYATPGHETIEPGLIELLRPVLNLTGWDNPSRKEIKALRKLCSDEARSRRSG